MSAPSDRMPVLFVGHGSPMNAIEDNRWSRGFAALGAALPAPRAVLAVSAHWYVAGTFVMGNEAPETIHDFGGFPAELFAVQYPAPGSGELARRVAALLAPARAAVSLDWGLDHGTWSVMRHIRAAADWPVVQLSIDRRLAPEAHLAIGRMLAPLRDEGVLVLGSGNVTHNLRHAFAHLGDDHAPTPAWAAEFDAAIARAVEQRDHDHLTHALEGQLGRTSHPTPDHYLPLLYAAGAAGAGDTVSFPTVGFDAGSLSMRSIRWG